VPREGSKPCRGPLSLDFARFVISSPELIVFHRAEHTLVLVVWLLQGQDKPRESSVQTLHRRIGNGEAALETWEMTPEMWEGVQHGMLWQR